MLMSCVGYYTFFSTVVWYNMSINSWNGRTRKERNQ
jgi:hypothetical protein